MCVAAELNGRLGDVSPSAEVIVDLVSPHSARYAGTSETYLHLRVVRAREGDHVVASAETPGCKKAAFTDKRWLVFLP